MDGIGTRRGDEQDLVTAAGAKPAPADGATRPGGRAATSRKVTTRQWARLFGPRNIGAIYVLAVLIVVFSIMSPSVFANVATAKLVLNEYSVTGLVGLALLFPLATSLFDLSVGSVAGLSGIVSAWMLANVSANPLIAVGAGLAVAAVVGIVNIGVVLGLGIDSFIGTLATSSIVTAIATAISGDNTIAKNVNGTFQHDVALVNLGGITLPVFIALAVAVVLFVVLEKTGFGRRGYAIGFDSEVARLGGVKVAAVRAAGLMMSSLIAGLAGILATAQIGAGNPATGPNYLIPAFAVAFLGATQFRGGRFNTWGAIVAVLLLGTGDVGLLTVGGPSWSPKVFEGAVLIAAVGLTASRGIGPIRMTRLRNRLQMATGRARAAAPSGDGSGGEAASDAEGGAALAPPGGSGHRGA